MNNGNGGNGDGDGGGGNGGGDGEEGERTRGAPPARTAASGPGRVRVVAYDPRWPGLFELERDRLEAALGERAGAIEHVGGTAVPGLDAKPIVDLMLGLESLEDGARCARLFEGVGYEQRGEAGVPGRIFLRKFTPYRYHLSLAPAGGEFWECHLLFRDYLRTHPATAREYARLKHELAGRYRYDREAYTEAKAGFVEAVVRRAKAARERGA
nr:GrpB family protein [Rubrobacter marinus]